MNDAPRTHTPAGTQMQQLRQHRPFMAYWLSRVLATGGFQILTVATAWQMYAITGRAIDLGLVGLLEFIPRVLFILQIGQAADRFDRRMLAALTKWLQAIVAITLCVLTITGGINREILFLLAFVLGTARAFDMPATQALLPNIVPAALLPTAIAAGASAMQAATIIAPALGGFLYAIGPSETYGLSAALLLLSGYCTLQLPRLPRIEQKQLRGFAPLFAGFRYIRNHPDILGAISLDLFAVLLGGATALLPIIASQVLHTGPWGLGLLRSAPAIGAISSSILLAYYPLKRHVGRKMFAAVIVFGLATIAFGLSHSLWLSLVALVVLGAADMVSVVVRGSLVQLQTPDDMRGRVSAVNALFIGASNQLGEFESGLTAQWFGTQPAIILGGVGTLLVAALWMHWFPGLRQYDSLTDKPST